jgi:hypothetical protein
MKLSKGQPSVPMLGEECDALCGVACHFAAVGGLRLGRRGPIGDFDLE